MSAYHFDNNNIPSHPDRAHTIRDKSQTSTQENDPPRSSDIPAGFIPATPEEKRYNRAVNRKLDIFLCPLLSILYLFSGLDRSNVGNAETEGTYPEYLYIYGD